jgi:hypothetical protein
VIETIQPPQPLLGLLTPKIVVPVLEEVLLAEAVALPFPVTYMIPPPVVDLVMEAEISDHQGPRQTDMKTHLMEGSLEVRGHTEVKQRLKDQMAPQAHTIQTVRTIPVQATAVAAETASVVPI